MEKRYQVFVSSTYEDLRPERQAVIQSLLEFDCIPVGMEFFPAADDSAWDIIKRVIEESDYYVVIVAGRYGSLTPEGISYTQKEYAYAVEKGVPVMAFLHDNPGKIAAEKTDSSEECRKKLGEFRELCRKHKLCKTWKTADELAGAVVKSLNHLKKTHERVGWVRADKALDDVGGIEQLKLRKRIEVLEDENRALRTTPPEGTSQLAQGDDVVALAFKIECRSERDYNGMSSKVVNLAISVEITWNQILKCLAPLLYAEASESDLGLKLTDLISEERKKEIFAKCEVKPGEILASTLRKSFESVIIQLKSLGLVIQSTKPRRIHDTEIYWLMTPFGDLYYSKLLAIRRPSVSSITP